MRHEKPELSKKNPYHLSRHRYYELKHFCFQYEEWKKALTLLDGWQAHGDEVGGIVKGNMPSDPTERCAILRAYYSQRIYKNLLIGGLVWFGATACKMLGESDKHRKEAEEDARKLKVALVHTQQVLDEVNRKNAEQFWAENSAAEPEPEKDICCDGKATITKKPE